MSGGVLDTVHSGGQANPQSVLIYLSHRFHPWSPTEGVCVRWFNQAALSAGGRDGGGEGACLDLPSPLPHVSSSRFPSVACALCSLHFHLAPLPRRSTAPDNASPPRAVPSLPTQPGKAQSRLLCCSLSPSVG